MHTPVERPLTFLRPQHPQHPRLTAIRIQDADLTRTTLNLAAYLNQPDPASNRIQLLDLVETPSLDRPLGNQAKTYH